MILEELEIWYYSNCNDDWEHQFGVTIDTLDNPGWRVQIDLEGTKLENVSFEKIENIEPELGWYTCKVEDKKFIGNGGPKKLNKIIEIFLDWAKLNKTI